MLPSSPLLSVSWSRRNWIASTEKRVVQVAVLLLALLLLKALTGEKPSLPGAGAIVSRYTPPPGIYCPTGDGCESRKVPSLEEDDPPLDELTSCTSISS